MSKNLLEVKNLEKYFEVSGGLFSRNKSTVKAVDGISFDIPFGSSLGLVGQSGCGKTTTARALSLLDPKTGGKINFYNDEFNGFSLFTNQNTTMPLIFNINRLKNPNF